MAERLEGMSPLKKLAQGYAYVADESGHCLSSIKGVAIGDPVQVYVRDGRMQAVIKEIDEDVAWKKKELTIEQSFAEIEEILNKLESNEVTLEDSFLLYQSGMQRIKHCNDLMNAVEQKVQMLNSNGELETFEEV